MAMAFLWFYGLVAVPFWLMDGVWLGLIAKRFYRESLGQLMARKVKLLPAVVFYAVYPAGLVLFIMMAATSPINAGLMGAAFGFFCYATYDLTNHATLEGWPLRLTLVDLAWGTVASGAACAIGKAAANALR
jgi:uncharacterized membrane protein